MEELLFSCPTCGASLVPPEEGLSTSCPRCARFIDLTGQFAYVRAFQAYEEAAEAMDDLKDAKKLKVERYSYEQRENHAYSLFSEAFSALQEAFRYELAEKQHEHGVTMMVSMAQLFLPRNLISGIEASYWNAVMVEQTARKELKGIETRLSGEGGLNFFTRWRANLRSRQLREELVKLDRQIRGIEKGLRLAHNYHPYKGRVK